jgi:hypothetical protein
VLTENERLLGEQVAALKHRLESQDIEMITLRLRNNEWEGLVIGTKAHNAALIERV